MLSIEQRRRELAIRKAVGATAVRLAFAVARRPVAAIAIGAPLAACLSVPAWSRVAALLYGSSVAEVTSAALLAIAGLFLMAGAAVALGIRTAHIHASEIAGAD